MCFCKILERCHGQIPRRAGGWGRRGQAMNFEGEHGRPVSAQTLAAVVGRGCVLF